MHAPRPTLSPPRPLAVLALLLALLALSVAAAAPARAQSSTQPTISINDPSPADEGDDVKFTVTLSSVPSETLSVGYGTLRIVGEAEESSSGCAGDYHEESSILGFAKNTTHLTQEIYVDTCQDDLNEAAEHFSVELFVDDDVPVLNRVGIGEIADDDPEPSLEIANATVTEPDTGTTSATFDIRLSEPSGQRVTFNIAPTSPPGTASVGAGCDIPGSDFENPTRTGEILEEALTPSEPVRVTVCGDLLDESHETFRVTLQTVVNASNAPYATGTILDDDPSPSLSINNATMHEGDIWTKNATFTVSLSTPSGRKVMVDWSTIDVTARGGDDCGGDVDYVSTGTVEIPAGAPSRPLTVPVCGDRPDEATETFRVAIAARNITATGTPQGIATIRDNDPVPILHFASALSRNELQTSETRHPLFVFLSDPRDGQLVDTGRGVDFEVNTLEGNDSDPSREATGATTCDPPGDEVDYEKHVAATHDIGVGSNKGVVFLNICGDTRVERSELFSVGLSHVQHATAPNATSVFRILNDDGPPSLAIANASGLEGGTMTFKVKLTGPTSEEVRVDYETRDGNARADDPNPGCFTLNGPTGNDYISQAGTVVFPATPGAPDVRFKTIKVRVCGDRNPFEFDEQFKVRLSRPDFARISVGDGTGTIS